MTEGNATISEAQPSATERSLTINIFPPSGPEPHSRATREAVIAEVVQRLQQKFGNSLQSVALYGSMARKEDLPWSDIEMMAIISGKHIDYPLEFISNGGRVEINIYSPDQFYADLDDFDEMWPLTHSAFLYNQPLFGDPAIFLDGRKRVQNTSPEKLSRIARALITGEIFELLAKVRNAAQLQAYQNIPVNTVKLAEYGIFLVGLQNRQLFRSAQAMFAEALQSDNKPSGLATLISVVQKGDLTDPEKLIILLEEFWHGVFLWAEKNQLKLSTQLEWPL